MHYLRSRAIGKGCFALREINFSLIGNLNDLKRPTTSVRKGSWAIGPPTRLRMWLILSSPVPALGEACGSRYYVQMAKRPSFVLVILPLIFFTLLWGCKPRPSLTVVVHLLRDLRSVYGSDMDRRILDYQGSNPRLKSGAPIVVASETGDYKDLLQRQTSNTDNIT